MPLNIIIKGGGKGKQMSGEEMARYLATKNQKAMEREKAGYMARQLKAREEMKQEGNTDTLRPSAVYDAKTYFRHEQERPGCMSDPDYKREYHRDNPESKM